MKESLLRSMPDIFLGIIISFTHLTILVSFCSMMYPGSLSKFLPIIIPLVVISSAILIIVGKYIYKINYFIGGIHDIYAIGMAIIISSFVLQYGESKSDEQILSTLLFLQVMAIFLIALFIYGIGRFKWGEILSYIPYTVIYGFLAGAGYILLTSAISIVSGQSFQWENHAEMTRNIYMYQYGFIAIFAMVMLVQKEKINSFHLLILLLFLCFPLGLAFVKVLSHIYPQEPVSYYVIDSINSNSYTLMSSQKLISIAHVDFATAFKFLIDIMIIAVVLSLTLMMEITGFVHATNSKVDINHRMKMTGTSNLYLSILGGGFNTQYMVFAIFLKKIGGSGKYVSSLSIIIPLLFMIFGMSILTIVPKASICVILAYIGADLIYSHLIVKYKILSKLDFFVILSVFLVIIFKGLMIGVVFGIVISIALFTWQCGKVSPVRVILCDKGLRSNLIRPKWQREILSQSSDIVAYISLQGALFFGNIESLATEVEKIIKERKGRKCYILVDFKSVIHLDVNALSVFENLVKIQGNKSVEYFLIKFPCQQLENQESLIKNMNYESLDYAIEFVENKIIDSYKTGSEQCFEQIDNQFIKKISQPNVLSLLERKDFKVGDIIYHKGDEADDMALLLGGEVAIYLEESGKNRVGKVLSGTLFGEMAFYLNIPRTATAMAMENTTVYFISKSALENLSQLNLLDEKEVHKYIIGILVERIVNMGSVHQAMF